MPTHQTEPNRTEPNRTKPNSDPSLDASTEQRAKRGPWVRRAVFSLIVLAIGVGFVASPFWETLGWARPDRPSADQLTAELESALDQMYRAFELDDEASTYDQIAQSATGETVREVYLEVRRSLSETSLSETSLPGNDGGQISIDRVWVDHVDQIRWLPHGGCRLDAAWAVSGTVGHFGHEHERQNRYRARIELLRQEDVWKISSIQITEQDRER